MVVTTMVVVPSIARPPAEGKDHMEKTETGYRMDKALSLGAVDLTVARLDRSLDYYTRAVGLRVLTHEADRAELGVSGRVLVTLRESPGALPPPPSSPGLSHFAPQVPTRADVARFAKHYADLGMPIDLRDHVVAQSCYVSDPDDHRIEVTCSRPRDEWRWQNGQPVVVADPMSLPDFLGEPGADLPFDGLPEATEMGHVQLKVTDAGLSATEPFYCDLLGFDVQARLGQMFLAVGVIDDQGMLVFTNRFSSNGGEPAPEGSARLLGVNLVLTDVDALAERLSAASYPHELSSGALTVKDPSGNLLRFTARAAPTTS
jgi:catechol 2,3-dioxygenase